jgi:sortase (surface protein transpeptidase)
MRHATSSAKSHKFPTRDFVDFVMRALMVCVVWVALGGTAPAHAAAPPTGAFAQDNQPTRLIIPALEVDATIEAVGQDDDGLMALPSSVATVAWYMRGPKPGETGNAVMAGHLDDVKGRPAIFWALDELEPGDEIVVRFGDKQEKRFEVMGLETYDADAAPLTRIFGVDFERDLNLITCNGAWDAQGNVYEERLVVYARLIRNDTNLNSNANEYSKVSESGSATFLDALTDFLRAIAA